MARVRRKRNDFYKKVKPYGAMLAGGVKREMMDIKNYFVEYKQNGLTFSNAQQVISMMGIPITDGYAIKKIRQLLPKDAKPIVIFEICGQMKLEEIERLMRGNDPRSVLIREIYRDRQLLGQYRAEVLQGDMS